MTKNWHLPPLGQRILKTAAAVFLCMFFHYLRGFKGSAVESAVAAIICMQPYKEDSRQASIDRIIGTLMGGIWGFLFLLLMEQIPAFASHMISVYVFMALGILLTLYTSVLFNQSGSAALAAIVYICIIGGYPDIEPALPQTIGRLTDTTIGILVAWYVNSRQLPRVRHPEYVFFVRLQDLVPDRFSHVSSTILVILNRLYNDGARICLTTRWAPAFLLGQMGTMEVNLPSIVMNGVAAYDIRDARYENILSLSMETAAKLREILDEHKLSYSVFTVRGRTMMIYSFGRISPMEHKEYVLMKRSPYRNYMDGEYTEEDQICAFRIFDEDARVRELEAILRPYLANIGVRILIQADPRMKDYSGLYLLHEDATIEHQKQYILEREQTKSGMQIVPVDLYPCGNIPYSDREAAHLLNRLRNIYEPVHLFH